MVAAAYGGALLGGTIADFGFSSNSLSTVAKDPTAPCIRALIRPAARRIATGALSGAALGVLSTWQDLGGSIIVATASAGIASALVAQLILTGVLYGLNEVRSASVRSGVARSILALGLPFFASVAHDEAMILAWIANIEIVVAIVLWIAVRREFRRLPIESVSAGPPPRGAHWLGVSTIFNILLNRSDTLIVSLLAAPVATGIYAVGSQIQNAISALAVAPSASLQRHVANEDSHGNAARSAVVKMAVTASLMAVAIGLGVAISLDFLGNQEFLSSYVPRTSSTTAAVVVLGCVAAPTSAAATVLLSAYVGVGRHRNIARVWAGAGFVCIPSTLVLTPMFGAVGAMGSAILRDLMLAALGLLLWRRYENRPRFGGRIVSNQLDARTPR